MSLRATARAFPTMLKTGFSEALAYRAEMLVWILTTTMPLVMLALWHAVAREAPIGRFGSGDVVAYFLAMFVVRQLTGSWTVWLMNEEIREGTLALRLLRPVHPLFAYAVKSLAELPVRGMLAVPIAGVALFVFAGDKLTRDPVLWAAFVASVFGGWMITLLTNIAIGCLALFIDSSAKVMDAWTSAFFVFSGYMIPVELFPRPLQIAADWLPFRYQLGLPVELMTGAHDRAHALAMLGRQWLVVAVLSVVVTLVWRRGLRRFDAFGG